MKKLKKLPSQVAIFFLKTYKFYFSPLLPPLCRYTPTCSEYMLVAIEKHGFLKGLIMGIARVFRCAPWGNYGFDPVPDHFTLLPQKTKNAENQ